MLPRWFPEQFANTDPVLIVAVERIAKQIGAALLVLAHEPDRETLEDEPSQSKAEPAA